MIKALLLIYIFSGASGSVTTSTMEFTSIKICEIAAEEIRTKIKGRVQTVCVATGR